MGTTCFSKMLLLSSISLFLCQCSTSDDPIPVEPEPSYPEGEVPPATKAVFDQGFDWDRVSRISLYNPNLGRETEVELPWVQGSTSSYGIPDSWIDPKAFNLDYTQRYYARENGWQLVYSNMNTTSITKYFTLYNKYTGIMRFFLYTISSASGSGNTACYWGLSLNKPTSLFNFTYDYSKAITEKTPNPGYIKSTPGSWVGTEFIGKGYLANNWFGFEVECAYDPLITPGSNYMFSFLGWAVNKTITTGQGETDGSLTGTVSYTSPSTTFNLSLSNMFNKSGSQKTIIADQGGVENGLGDKIQKGINKNDSFFKGLWNNIKQKAGAGIGDGVKTALSSLLTSGGSLVTKALGGLMSSVLGIGGSKPSTASVDLRMHSVTNFEFQSEAILPGWGGITQLPVPGANSSGVDQPLYNKALGVWNLSKTPIVNIEGIAHNLYVNHYDFYKGVYRVKYFIDCSQNDIVLNNEIKNAVTIDNFNVQIVVEENNRYVFGSGQHIGQYGNYLPIPASFINDKKFYSVENFTAEDCNGAYPSALFGSVFSTNYDCWGDLMGAYPAESTHGIFKAIVSFDMTEKSTGKKYSFSRWFDVKFGTQRINYRSVEMNSDSDYNTYLTSLLYSPIVPSSPNFYVRYNDDVVKNP